MVSEIAVLRYGHRIIRDERVTTHCCLVARAFGAGKIIIDGEPDRVLEDTVQQINYRFGGSFALEFTVDWKKQLKMLKNEGYVVVHLTMYGEDLTLKRTKSLKKNKKIAVLIGSQKVPAEAYQLSDYNISITNQPHSEIAALAVFLDRVVKKSKNAFGGAQIKIVPQKHGKKVISSKNA